MNFCPLCKKEEFLPLSRFNLLRCKSCDLVMDKNVWDLNSNLKLEEKWFEGNDENNWSFWIKIFENLNNKKTWKRIHSFISPGCNLLEIGVGSGSFLNFAKERGLNVKGCDLSKTVCREVGKFNISMFNGSIFEYPNNIQFEFVVMNHILEHVNNPIDTLEVVKSRLKKNGILHLAVPNINCWESFLPGWTSYEPYHLLYFSPKTLRNTLINAGFIIIKQRTHESFSGWFLAFIRTALKTNQKSSAKRSVEKQKLNLTIIEHLYRILMIIAGFISFPFRVFQEKMGFGDEIIILAKVKSEDN